jgi:hypothetical protein
MIVADLRIPRWVPEERYRVLCENPDCRRPFSAARRDAMYCSNACRQWAYRHRDRDNEELSNQKAAAR